MKKSILSFGLVTLASFSLWAQPTPAVAPTPPVAPVAPVPAALPSAETRSLVQESVDATEAAAAELQAKEEQLRARAESLQEQADKQKAEAFQFAYAGGFGGSSGSSGGAGLLVSFGQLDQKKLDETSEDLAIFDVILKRDVKRIGQDEPDYRLGVPMLLNSHDAIHAAYIEGFGAVFNFRVPFPLIAPPATQTKSQPAPADTEWDRARRSLYGRSSGGSPEAWAEGGESGAFGQIIKDYQDGSKAKGAAYNAEWVDQLKKGILSALKSAGHFRHLKSSEWIVVTVTGPASKGDGADSDSAEKGRPTMLTVRVKKSVADSVASKSISDEQFDREADVNTYFGSNESGGGVSSSVMFLR